MALIRVPYPSDPESRRAVFERLLGSLERYGSVEGTTEAGTFQGSTPIGSFAGSYSSPAGSDLIEIDLVKKPWLVSTARIESEARRLFTA